MSTIHLALTGHRPPKLAGYHLDQPYYHNLQDTLMSIIKKALQTYDTVWVHTGLALGADTIWGFAGLQAAHQFPQRVKLHAEVPLLTQAAHWPNLKDRQNWQTLINHASAETIYGKTYYPALMQKRNQGMIDHCDQLIAIWDGSSGGTANAVHYAQTINKPIIYFNPNQFKN